MWKFRFHLAKTEKNALTKFVKCVYWNGEPAEIHQAIECMSRWTDVRIEDALELLGPQFINKRVRGFAVAQLERAEDEVYMLLLHA